MARSKKPPPVVPAPPPFVAVDFGALVGVIRETVREVMREQAPPPPPQPGPEPAAEWLTSRDAAALLKLKPATLEIWRMRGKGPRYSRIGRAVRYARADVNAFARDGR